MRLEDQSEGEEPRSNLSLVLISDGPEGEQVTAPIEVRGICSYAAAGPSELQRVRCWWLGQERTFVLRQDGNALLLIELDAGSRATLELPEDSDLHVLGE